MTEANNWAERCV